jgi:phage shock protein PspC (stress-responsive transcriptional regulator)
MEIRDALFFFVEILVRLTWINPILLLIILVPEESLILYFIYAIIMYKYDDNL